MVAGRVSTSVAHVASPHTTRRRVAPGAIRYRKYQGSIANAVADNQGTLLKRELVSM